MPPIPVAARASGPRWPTMATSTKLMITRLRLLIMTGKAKNQTELNIFWFWGNINFLIKTYFTM